MDGDHWQVMKVRDEMKATLAEMDERLCGLASKLRHGTGFVRFAVDADLERGLARYQRRHGLTASGAVRVLLERALREAGVRP
jgi:hypothetical protein